MSTTIKSVCDEVKDALCKAQDFETAAAVRALQRAVDPDGIKRVTETQAKAIKAFLEGVLKQLSSAQVEVTKSFLEIVVETAE